VVIILKDKYLAKNDEFILSRYDFNLETSKLLFACLYKANSDFIKPIINQKSHIYQLDFSEIKKYCGISYDLENDKRVIDRITKDLTSKIVQFTTPRGSWKTVGIIKSFDVISEKKLIEIEIDNDLKPYLVEEFKRFTKLGFKHLGLCKSKYSFRLYEILIAKSKSIVDDIKIIKISVEELRDILQFPKSQSYSDLKKRVLEVANTEYNANDIENIQEKKDKKLFKAFTYKPIETKMRGKGKNPITHIIFEFELLEETKLLMMSKIEKIEAELNCEDWIITSLRSLIEKNQEREAYFKTVEINYIYSFTVQTIENIKKEYNVFGNLSQLLISKTIENAFNKFTKNKSNEFETFLINGFKKNCDYYLEKEKSLQEY
jgi:hypothetical protein